MTVSRIAAPVLISSLSLLPLLPAQAQLIPDATLGAESSRVEVQGLRDRILGGAARGENLFHSFQEFNVNTGQQVYFANPDGIANILTRVTGGNISNILGTLGVEGGANLFLLNPNGIYFGPNAHLDVAGSFYASTAESWPLGLGHEFSATTPEAPPLLTLNITPGVQYPANYQGDLVNDGLLTVGEGQTLHLSGQTVDLHGGLQTSSGSVEVLGAQVILRDTATIDVSGEQGGTVVVGGDFRGEGPIPTATHTLVAPNARIRADVTGNGSGSTVAIWADNTTAFYGDISATGGTGGTVEVSGKETLIFRGNVATQAADGTPGTLLLDPRNIFIAAGSGDGDGDGNTLSFQGDVNGIVGQLLSSDFVGQDITIYESELEAIAGNTAITLEASQNITFAPFSDGVLRFQEGTGAIAFVAGGDITLQDTGHTIETYGRDISFTGTHLSLGAIDTGNTVSNPSGRADDAGSVTLRATGDINSQNINTWGFLNGNTLTVEVGGELNLGNVMTGFSDALGRYRGRLVRLTAGQDVNVGTVTAGNTAVDSHAVEITAGGQVTAGNISAQSAASLGGRTIQITAGGDINGQNIINSAELAAGRIELTAGGNIFTNTLNASAITSDGNTIKLNALGSIQTGEVNTSSALSGNDAGDVDFLAGQNLSFGNINTVSNRADGGDVRLESQNTLNLGAIAIQTDSLGNGSGGDVVIRAPQLNLVGTTLSTTASGSGNAGNITLIGTQNLRLTQGTQVFSVLDIGANGEGGDIALQGQTIQLEGGAFVDTGTAGTGSAGNLTVQANTLNVQDSYLYSFTAGQGDGGQVDVQVGDRITLNNGFISTAVNTLAQGDAGNVNITGRSLDLTNGAQIQSLTRGLGEPGDVNINIRDRIFMAGRSSEGFLTGVFTSSDSPNQQGGNVTLRTQDFRLQDGAIVSAQTFNTGKGGTVDLLAHTITLANGGQLLSRTNGPGEAGDLFITATGSLNIQGQDPNFASRPTPLPLLRADVPARAFADSLVNEQPNNNTIATAQALTHFSLAPVSQPNIYVAGSTFIPHAAVVGDDSDDTVDFYSFEVNSATRGIFDVDTDTTYVGSPFSPGTQLTLFDAQGNQLATQGGNTGNEGSAGSMLLISGGGGGISPDSYLSYFFPDAGTYYLRVSRPFFDFGTSTFVLDGGVSADYGLQVSLETPNIIGEAVTSDAESGIFANTSIDSTGSGGIIQVNAPETFIGAGGQIAVDSQGTGLAGDIGLSGQRLRLDRGVISTEAASNDGGNLNFNVSDPN